MSLPFVKRIRMWSSALAIAGGLGLAAGEVGAQTPAVQAAKAPTKYVVKNTVFHLPFKIGQSMQANAREMHLWMREDSGQWKLVDRVPPTASFFTCRVPRAGEYGFSIVTVDRRGNPSPRDVTRRAPDLMVIVDTRLRTNTPPVASALPPAPSALPAASEVTPAVLSEDIAPAENTVPATGNQPSSPNQASSSSTEIIVPVNEPAPLRIPSNHVVGMASGTGSKIVRPPVAPAAAPHTPATEENAEPVVTQEEIPGATPLSTIDRTVKGPVVLLVNNTHVSVEYNVGKAGPSGLAKVIIYATSDQGQTWTRLGEDADRHSPADINLPGEGTYGIRMSGVNGNGFGGKTPAIGAQPHTTIEVDLTKPVITGWRAGLAKSGCLEIHWKAVDKNLGAQPINLFYRTSRTGAWKPLASKLKNDGSFRWQIARDLAAQYYIRMEVADMAGNMASCETQQPILVDRTEPDINVTGVTVIQTRPSEPGGNLVPASGESRDGEQ